MCPPYQAMVECGTFDLTGARARGTRESFQRELGKQLNLQAHKFEILKYVLYNFRKYGHVSLLLDCYYSAFQLK